MSWEERMSANTAKRLEKARVDRQTKAVEVYKEITGPTAIDEEEIQQYITLAKEGKTDLLPHACGCMGPQAGCSMCPCALIQCARLRMESVR